MLKEAVKGMARVSVWMYDPGCNCEASQIFVSGDE